MNVQSRNLFILSPPPRINQRLVKHVRKKSADHGHTRLYDKNRRRHEWQFFKKRESKSRVVTTNRKNMCGIDMTLTLDHLEKGIKSAIKLPSCSYFTLHFGVYWTSFSGVGLIPGLIERHISAANKPCLANVFE